MPRKKTDQRVEQACFQVWESYRTAIREKSISVKRVWEEHIPPVLNTYPKRLHPKDSWFTKRARKWERDTPYEELPQSQRCRRRHKALELHFPDDGQYRSPFREDAQQQFLSNKPQLQQSSSYALSLAQKQTIQAIRLFHISIMGIHCLLPISRNNQLHQHSFTLREIPVGSP